MGLFSRKKPEPEKKPVIKVVKNDKPVDLRIYFLNQCNANTQAILSKLARKRDEMLHMLAAEGKEEEIEERFERLADFVTSMNWDVLIRQTLKASCYTDIDNNWTNRIDVENVKFFLNMQWKIIRVDMNSMINDIINLVEGEGA